MQATSVPDLVERARAYPATPEEAEAVDAALDHFTERFDFLWAEFDWLVAFAGSSTGSSPSRSPGQWDRRDGPLHGRVGILDAHDLFSFVAVPSQEYGTHARGERAGPAASRCAPTTRSPSRSRSSSTSWCTTSSGASRRSSGPTQPGRYVREGYRGADGQNSLLARSAPHRARPRASPSCGWRRTRTVPSCRGYHLESIDRYAHALLPLVSAAFDSGQRFAEIPPAQVIDALDDATLSEAPALLFLGEAAFSATEDLLPLLDPLLADVGGRRQWRVAADSGDGTSSSCDTAASRSPSCRSPASPPLPGLEGRPPPRRR